MRTLHSCWAVPRHTCRDTSSTAVTERGHCHCRFGCIILSVDLENKDLPVSSRCSLPFLIIPAVDDASNVGMKVFRARTIFERGSSARRTYLAVRIVPGGGSGPCLALRRRRSGPSSTSPRHGCHKNPAGASIVIRTAYVRAVSALPHYDVAR